MKSMTTAIVLLGVLSLATPVAANYLAPVTRVAGARADGVRVMTAVVVAEIVNINFDTREVTLRDEQGEEVTIVAPEKITRLEDHSVGDRLVVEYLSSIAGEMREPTEDELKNPWMEVSDTAVSTDVTHPAIGAARQFRSIATIKALDRETRTAVIEDARGRSHTITDVKPEKFEGVAVGDRGVVVFTEAIAVSVERQLVTSD